MQILSTFPDLRPDDPQRRSLRVARSLRQFKTETEFQIPDGTEEFARWAREKEFAVNQCNPQICRVSMLDENVRHLFYFRNTVSRVRSLSGFIRFSGRTCSITTKESCADGPRHWWRGESYRDTFGAPSIRWYV